ncbi:diadenylate cyclase CdaA [Armatimonas sp.]|uniref:diadenylate cyclase CdaA n=1 Tax=Armatimonas sp. TaxID=1872638 RepID=UPI00374FF073
MSALFASLRSIDFKSLALAALDIVVVAYILYRLILLAKGRRAWQILIGIGVFFLLLLLSDWLELVTLNWLLRSVTPLGPVAIVILLYPELREVLERLGRLDFWGAPLSAARQENITETVEAIVTAATLLSARKTGVLIVLARETGLDDVIATGTVLDAGVTPELLTTIFYSGTALHDGAVILRNGRIVAAGCTLPLSDAPNIATNVHMRHRAAMGVSENSDAVVVIVSEETGTISLSIGGKLDRGLKPELLREKLLTAFGKGVKKALPRLSLTRRVKEIDKETSAL